MISDEEEEDDWLFKLQFVDTRSGSDIHSFMISKSDMTFDFIKSMLERKISDLSSSEYSLFLTSEGKGKQNSFFFFGTFFDLFCFLIMKILFCWKRKLFRSC